MQNWLATWFGAVLFVGIDIEQIHKCVFVDKDETCHNDDSNNSANNTIVTIMERNANGFVVENINCD